MKPTLSNRQLPDFSPSLESSSSLIFWHQSNWELEERVKRGSLMRCRADERVEDSHYSQEYSFALVQKLVQGNIIIFPEMEALRDWIYPVSQYYTAIWGVFTILFFPERECIEFIYCQYWETGYQLWRNSVNYMNFSTVSDRWSTCDRPEIHFIIREMLYLAISWCYGSKKILWI